MSEHPDRGETAGGGSLDLDIPDPELAGDPELPGRIIRELSERGLHLGVAESCTGGLITKKLTDPPGASAALVGGVVAYANEVKIDFLGVAPETIERHGAVSAETAREMAAGVRRLLKTDLAISVTGVAGPGGGSAAKPVGTVWIGAATQERTGARHFLFRGDRETIRERAAEAALAILWRLLRDG